jgi:hypothetical protein
MSTKIPVFVSIIRIAPEQHEIKIGEQTRLQRRRIAGATARAAQESKGLVTIAGCGECGLKIGQCSCSNGSARAFASAPGAGGGMGGGSGNYVATPFDVPTPGPGCYPRSACDRDSRFVTRTYAEVLRDSRMAKAPYMDPYYDSIYMDELVSEPTTLPAAVTTNIEVTPQFGTFAAFYYEIVVVDPNTQVQQVDWRSARPRVEGCPVPCGSGDTLSLAQLVQKVPEACCGNPLVAWLDESARNVPLIVPVANNQAAGDLLGQVRLRGYCCSNRVC